MTIWTEKPTLYGELVTLRPITAADAGVVDAWLREEPEIALLMGSVHSPEEPSQDVPIERMREVYGQWAVSEERLVLGIVDRASGALVGEAVLNDWDEGNRSCNFRILMCRAGRGRGLGTEATRLITDYGLSVGLHRISLEVYAFNPAARRAYEKAGFVAEGRLRDALLYDGEWVDAEVMARVAEG
ncbi:acetyltransferase [Actinomyces radicidentis]|uniref:Acetyltransferase n=1 Tax=Actinomyces radicidentis TaxID=111015 RepID=A0A0X8JDV7_ACTRD|nr:GNAT family protein [Actinomyces radicidentis]AMD87037.1 acetyltransferase [Actinomyces radicidentis]